MCLRLLASALVEPFFYPMHTFFAVRGNLEALGGKQGWGKAKRSGFEKKKKAVEKAGSKPDLIGKSGMAINPCCTI